MYGRGAYFAEEADYSHNGYVYKVPGSTTGDCQMFLCRLAAGNVEQRTPDQSIKGPSNGYDSVRGPVRGQQQAYILYDFYQSYPEYLITYRGK